MSKKISFTFLAVGHDGRIASSLIASESTSVVEVPLLLRSRYDQSGRKVRRYHDEPELPPCASWFCSML